MSTILIQEAIVCDAPRGAVARYVSDFENLSDWDPYVSSSERLTGGELVAGSRFEVSMQMRGRQVPIDYEVTKHEPGHSIRYQGKTSFLSTVEDFEFVSVPGGTRVTYRAIFTLKGAARFIAPFARRHAAAAARKVFESLAATVAAPKATPPAARAQA